MHQAFYLTRAPLEQRNAAAPFIRVQATPLGHGATDKSRHSGLQPGSDR